MRDRLSEGGLFCQWLPLYQPDPDTLRTISRTFVSVFPNASVWLCRISVGSPTIGLIGRRGDAPLSLSSSELFERLASDPAIRARLLRSNLADDSTLLGNFICGPAELSRWSASAAINTDDRPVVLFCAPRFTCCNSGRPADRRRRLLADLPSRPQDLVDLSDRLAARRAAYWTARAGCPRALARFPPPNRPNCRQFPGSVGRGRRKGR